MTEHQTPYQTMPHANGATAEVLAYLKAHIQEHGYSPNYRELALGAGLASTSAVAYHVRLLETRGLVTRTPGIARSVYPVDESQPPPPIDHPHMLPTIPELARHLRCLADGPPQPGRMKQLRAGLRRLDALCHQED